MGRQAGPKDFTSEHFRSVPRTLVVLGGTVGRHEQLATRLCCRAEEAILSAVTLQTPRCHEREIFAGTNTVLMLTVAATVSLAQNRPQSCIPHFDRSGDQTAFHC